MPRLMRYAVLAAAQKMGADNFYDKSDRDTLKKLRGYFDIIINTVSVELDSSKYMRDYDNGSASKKGNPDCPLLIVSARHSLAGSAICVITEIQEMLNFCSLYRFRK